MEPENIETYDPEQPRQPRNLQDVLRYAVEAGGSPAESEARTSREFDSLDPERRRFLEEVVESFTDDITKAFKEALETLNRMSKDTLAPETYECALDVIADRVDNIDAANDYVKVGGFAIVEKCLASENPGIRWRIADIVANCTQNNPFCQHHAVQMRFLEPLMTMVDKDTDERCRTKAFFAISNIVRDSLAAMEEFMRLNGFSAVKKAMMSNNEKLRNKAAFFFSSVVPQNPSIVWDVASMGFTEVLISLLKAEPSPSHEFIASSLLFLAQENKEALAVCKKDNLQLEATLKGFLSDQNTKDCYTVASRTRKFIASFTQERHTSDPQRHSLILHLNKIKGEKEKKKEVKEHPNSSEVNGKTINAV